MVNYNRDRPAVPKNRLLYDKEFLADVTDDLGNAIEIKQEVKTTALVWEIRAAQEFWFGGQFKAHRMSEHVWRTCRAFDNGQFTLNDDHEIVYSDTEAA